MLLFSLTSFEKARIVDTYHEAKAEVEAMKKDWGWGVSTLVIVHNDTPLTLIHMGKQMV